MHNTVVKIECPKCGYPAQASIKMQTMRFIFFICPECQSNVVYYDNKLDVISDAMVNKLIQRNRLIECGNITSAENSSVQKAQTISSDDLLDLKIAIETSKSIEDFLKNI